MKMFKIITHINEFRNAKLQNVCIFVIGRKTSFTQSNHQNTEFRKNLCLKAFNQFERLFYFPMLITLV